MATSASRLFGPREPRALRRLVETQLFDVRALDAPTIAIAAIGLVLLALGAAALPAWRASRLDPNAALKVG